VTAVGENKYGQCNVSDWRDMVAVAAGCGHIGNAHTAGLKGDGAVVAAGDHEHRQRDVSSWHDIQRPDSSCQKLQQRSRTPRGLFVGF
jgi:hypothetical protein